MSRYSPQAHPHRRRPTSPEKSLIDGKKTIEIEQIRKLKVGHIAGWVTIVGQDEPGARVEVHCERGRALTVTINGDTLEIDHPELGWDNFIEVFKSFFAYVRPHISIMAPRDVDLKFGIVTAGALINGLTEDARIGT